ncbi:MAG: fimbria/pilus outer membrane usher protein [Rhabdaerophilum sp.]
MARASPRQTQHLNDMRPDRMMARLCRVLVLLLGLVLPQGILAATKPPEGSQKLMLEVFINGDPTNLIAEFHRRPDGRFLSMRSELREIGVAVPKGNDKDLIELEGIPGFGLRYDEPAQKLYVSLSPEMRLAKEYAANEAVGHVTQEKVGISSDFGSVLNYNLYGTSTRGYTQSAKMFNTGSVTLDHRAFSPVGVLQNTAIAGTTLAKKGILRLDSSFVYAHPETMTMATMGDSISGGLNWTRPIRYGGGQISRQFALRPDLVTAALPSVGGSAAVPSTVEVYVDNIRVASRDVGAGPFRLNNIPVPGESGTARVVVRDVTGRETVTTVPFFTSSKLLSAGQFDYSLDGGVPRYNYAIESFDYGRKWIGMGTLRYGLTEKLTLEGHAEATPGLVNGGAGVTFGFEKFGLFSVAGAASWHRDTLGGLFHASWQNTIRGVFIGVGTQRTFGRYEDVASVTARRVNPDTTGDLADSGFFVLNRSARMPRAIDRLTIGVPIAKWNASMAASFVNLERADGERSHLLSLTYSQTFKKKYNVFVSAYSDFADSRQAGISAGLSFSLGDDLILTSSIAGGRDSRSASFEAIRPLGTKTHDYGWRVYTNEGANMQRGASGTYRNPWAQIGAGIRQDASFIGGFAELDGAVVANTSGVFPSRRVNDAFAIVDAGAAGVEVLHENRPVGKTNWFGKAVIPDLRSFQRSKIAISPETVPAGNHVTLTEQDVIPGFRGSSTVRVKSIAATDTARVQLHNEKGEAIPIGAIVTHGETGTNYTIGYGGMIFIPGIGDSNTLVVQHGDKTCQASFSRDDRKGTTGRVGPLVCKGE